MTYLEMFIIFVGAAVAFLLGVRCGIYMMGEEENSKLSIRIFELEENGKEIKARLRKIINKYKEEE